MIVEQNSLMNNYVPTFFIKNLRHGQGLRYDAIRKAYINADIVATNSPDPVPVPTPTTRVLVAATALMQI